MREVVGLVEPLPEGRRLSGTYEYAFTGGNLTGSSVFEGHVSFESDGTFRISKSSFGGSDVMGSSVYAASSCGPDGGSSSTSISGGLVGGTSRKDSSCGDGRSGTYEIDGFAVTLTRDDGEVNVLALYATDVYPMLGKQGYWKVGGK